MNPGHADFCSRRSKLQLSMQIAAGKPRMEAVFVRVMEGCSINRSNTNEHHASYALSLNSVANQVAIRATR